MSWWSLPFSNILLRMTLYIWWRWLHFGSVGGVLDILERCMNMHASFPIHVTNCFQGDKPNNIGPSQPSNDAYMYMQLSYISHCDQTFPTQAGQTHEHTLPLEACDGRWFPTQVSYCWHVANHIKYALIGRWMTSPWHEALPPTSKLSVLSLPNFSVISATSRAQFPSLR